MKRLAERLGKRLLQLHLPSYLKTSATHLGIAVATDHMTGYRSHDWLQITRLTTDHDWLQITRLTTDHITDYRSHDWLQITRLTTDHATDYRSHDWLQITWLTTHHMTDYRSRDSWWSTPTIKSIAQIEGRNHTEHFPVDWGLNWRRRCSGNTAHLKG